MQIKRHPDVYVKTGLNLAEEVELVVHIAIVLEASKWLYLNMEFGKYHKAWC